MLDRFQYFVRRAFSRRLRWIWAAGALVAAVTGCKTVGYYQQAAAGQMEIFSRREPITDVLRDPGTTPELKNKLELILSLREFAERELGLETGGHYLRYADLERPYVVWNVYAAPELSLEPKKWWYPIVGSLKYRGFFSENDARAYAASLEKKGYDVYVGGVDAYSTLGWFKDPVLNTFIDHKAADLAELLFHELAHQRVFAKGDTDFNEAFATAVAEEGVRRWLAKHGDAAMRAEYEIDLRRKNEFVRVVMQAREELRQVYGEEANGGAATRRAADARTVAEQRAKKEEVIARLRREYADIRARWGGYPGYDRWFKRSLNNAQLNTVATYYHLVPAFKALLAGKDAQIEAFYQAVDELARLDRETRREQLLASQAQIVQVTAEANAEADLSGTAPAQTAAQ